MSAPEKNDVRLRYRLVSPGLGDPHSVTRQLHAVLRKALPHQFEEQRYCKPRFRKYKLRAHVDAGGRVEMLFDEEHLWLKLIPPDDAPDTKGTGGSRT